MESLFILIILVYIIILNSKNLPYLSVVWKKEIRMFFSQQLSQLDVNQDNFIIHKENYYNSVNKIRDLHDYLRINTSSKSLKNNLTYYALLKLYLVNLVKTVPTINLTNIIRIINPDWIGDKYPKYKKLIQSYSKIFVPINIKVKKNILKKTSVTVKRHVEEQKDSQLVTNIFEKLFKQSEKNENLILKIEGVDISIPMDDKIIVVYGYFKADQLNSIKNIGYIYFKLYKINNELDANNFSKTFQYEYLDQYPISNLIMKNENEIINDAIRFNQRIRETRNKNLTQMLREFQRGSIMDKRDIIVQLLLDNVSENSYYLVHLLFEYLLDNTFHTGMNVQKNIFNSLHWNLKQKFILTEREYSKPSSENINEEEISYEKRIKLMKAPDYIKNKALSKFKESERSRDSNAKCLQYLDGLLKIPFGYNCVEEIFEKFNYFKELLVENDVHLDIQSTRSIDAYLKNSDKTTLVTEWNKLRGERLGYLDQVKNILDQSVHGHMEAKQCIENLIGKWLNGNMKGIILGIQGPPGNGKTTLIKQGLSKCLMDRNGKSRPFAFIPLGGSTNGSTLEGHNYTYTGSTWGKIVDVLMETNCMNPIFYFDELDKVSNTEHGREIIGILTHMTDFSQNDEFQDKYFAGIKFDLSKAIFVFTYNDIHCIDRILRDRITNINTYPLNLDDKIHIVRNFLFPEIIKEVGISETDIIYDDTVIKYIVDNYTYEAGVRKLKEKINYIVSYVNLHFIKESNAESEHEPFVLTVECVDKILADEIKIERYKCSLENEVGMVNGLFATTLGNGGITQIQLVKRASDKFMDIEMTGSQGDVMKQSIVCAKTIAWNLISAEMKNKIKGVKNFGLHLHCPDTSTPKDGPSAGGAITLALYSVLTNKKVIAEHALTGEIDIQGNIKRIGGVYSKLEGAKFSGIKKVLLPEENRDDYNLAIKKHPNLVDSNFEVTFVKHVKEIIDIMIEKN